MSNQRFIKLYLQPNSAEQTTKLVAERVFVITQDKTVKRTEVIREHGCVRGRMVPIPLNRVTA